MENKRAIEFWKKKQEKISELFYKTFNLFLLLTNL
jgi:hypothetical protein